MPRDKTVLVFGTFDFFHVGHLHLLRQAKTYGNRLVVAVASDAAVAHIKGQRPVHDEEERKGLVSALRMVDDTVLGDETLGVYSPVRTVAPDVIVLGYDQSALAKDLNAFLKKQQLDIPIQRATAYKPNDANPVLSNAHSIYNGYG